MDDVDYGKLDRGVKKRWVRALRSGKYNQGKHSLVTHYNEDFFCCLGVYCEISSQVKRADNCFIFNGDAVCTALPADL